MTGPRSPLARHASRARRPRVRATRSTGAAGQQALRRVAAEQAPFTRMTLVFKDGVGYDSAKLFASVEGWVGAR